MRSHLIHLWNDESGASAAEYALILAIIGTGIAIAATFLGGTMSNTMNQQANKISDCNDGSC